MALLVDDGSARAVLYEDDATNVLSRPVEYPDFDVDPGGGKYPILFLEPMLEYSLLDNDGTLEKEFAKEGGPASMLIPKHCELRILEYAVLLLVDDGMFENTVCAEEGGAAAATLVPKPRESPMLEYAVLLLVDDGMFENTVCAEEGGPATMLVPKSRESLMLEYAVLLIVDDGMLIKVYAEEGGPATILLVADDDIAGPE